MTVQSTVVENVAVFTMSGAQAHRTDGSLRARVDDALQKGLRDIVIDCGAVTQLGAEGLGELVGTYAAVCRVKGRLVLSAVPHRVHFLLAASGLERLFETVRSTPDAVRSMTPGHAA